MVLKFITLLLICQLTGEVIAVAAGIPIPGPVIGMALLFGGLVIRGNLPEGLGTTSDGLLRHLSLRFVPAGVGVMSHLSLLHAQWDALLAALIGSTLATIVATGLVMTWLNRRANGGEG